MSIKQTEVNRVDASGVGPEAYVLSPVALGNGDGPHHPSASFPLSVSTDEIRWPGRAVLLLSAYAFIGGLISCIGWVADVPRLTDWNNEGISIQPNTTIAVMAAGAAVSLLHFSYRRIAASLGVLVTLIGITSVFQIVTDINIGINELLMFGREWGRHGTISPGRMGTPGAVSWTLIGTALIFLSTSLAGFHGSAKRSWRKAAVTLSLIALTVSSLSIIGYLYNAEILFTLPRLTVIALQTATFIFALSLAMVMSVIDVGPMRLVVDTGTAGVVIRRTVPSVILICLILGFLRIAGETAGFYDRAFGTAARTLIEIGFLLGLLWWTAAAISRQSRHVEESDRTLRESEQRFARFMQNLPGLAWIKDQAGRYVFANESAERAFGKAGLELYGKTDVDVFPPETAAAFVENDRLALQSETGRQSVEVLKDQEGIIRHSIVNKFPIHVSGEIPMIGGIAIDITEQRQVQENQEFLFKIAERIRVGLDAEDLLAGISDEVGKYLNLHLCLFNEIDLENDVETVHRNYSRTGESVSGKHKISSYSPITSKEMMAGHTVINRNSEADPRTAELFEKIYSPNRELSYVAVPMMRGGKWVASLWCSDDKPRNWTDAEVALLENVGERTWAAIERIRAEHLLRETTLVVEKARDYAEAILRSSPVPLLVLKHDLTVAHANDAFYLKFKVEPSETEGRKVYELGNGQWDIPELRQLLEEMLPNYTWFEDFEVSHDFEDIGRRVMLLNARRMEVPGGEIERIVLVIEDMTESKLATEAALRLAAIVESSDDAIIGKNIDGIITSWNGGAERLFGYSAKEAVGHSITMLIPPDRLDEEPEILRRLRRGESVDHFETVRQRKDGTLLDISLTISPIRDANGQIVGASKVARDITDRKRTEDALREAEARSQLAQKAGNVGVWDWDFASAQTYWSDAMWELYGERPGSADPNKAFWAAKLHEEDRERVLAKIDSLLSSKGSEYDDEFRIVHKDGQIRWLEAIATVARDEDGTAMRMYGVNLDVTDKKVVAERIRASETQLRLITNAIPALVSYCDVTERYRFVNRRYSEWFGSPREQIIGQKIRDVAGARAYDVIKLYIDEVLRGESVSFDGWVDYKVAGRRFVHVSYVPDFGPAGEMRGFFALVSDLSELRKSEEQLKASLERTQLLTESFTDYAIISTDVEGKIESWNPGAATIFGYSENEVIGNSTDILFTPEDVDRQQPTKEMREARKVGRASSERWYVKKDGSRFFASVVMAPLYIGKDLTGYAMIAVDLTERKRNAEALQRAHDEMEMHVRERTRELAQANAALTDEIKVRKTAERERIQLLQRLVTTQEDERRRIARDLHDQLGQRMTALRLKIASLKDVAGGNSEVEPRVTRLQEIAEGLDSEISFLAWELRPRALSELGLIDATGTFVREWSRHYDIPAEFHVTQMANLHLHVDADIHLYRIAQEALNNVAKHAKAKHVSVLLECTDDVIVLIVEDDGKGFDAAALSKEKKGGKGLGLTGMRERSALIDGTLEVETSPGSGTTIYVKVPVKAPENIN